MSRSATSHVSPIGAWLMPIMSLALALGGAHGAAARDLTLTLTPELPTWADSVRLRVAGEVVTSCGASVMHLANVRKPATLGPPLLVEVDLVEDPCTVLAPPITVPFALEVELGHLLPGSTTVQVDDLAVGTAAQHDLLVYDVSRLGLEVPAVATNAAAVKVGVTFYSDCSSIEPQVSGNAITLTYSDGCQITPPPPQLTRREIDVGLLPPGQYEVRLVEPFAFPAPALRRLPLRVWDAIGCVPSGESLCLQNGRFRLTATWRAFDGTVGTAHAALLPGNQGSGLFWFFGPDNAELTVKVLDACGVDGDWWAYVASGSTVEYTLTVTDTNTGVSRTYRNPLGSVPELISDTDAFDCP